MRAFVLGIAGLLPAAIAQNQPDPAGILAKVGETYANAKQYRFEMKKSGEESGTLQIAIRTPSRFHFYAEGSVIDGADSFDRVTMVSDGGSAWNYIGGRGQYTRKNTSLPLLDTEPPEVSPETFVLQAEVVFLSRYARFAKAAASSARLLRQETIPIAGGTADCYVFEIHAPLPAFQDDYTWWVDKNRYLVLREDTKPSSARRKPSSTIYTLASIDEPVPEELFHFTPPPGAKQVDRFESDAAR